MTLHMRHRARGTIGPTAIRVVAILATALLALAVLPAPPASADDRPASTAEVYRALGLRQVAAHFVILLDTSASMQNGNAYGAVRDSLRELFVALAPQDIVTLQTFDSRANSPVWNGPLGDAPDAPIAKLPASATGSQTDIGAAIAAGVQALAAGQPRIATLVLITDGNHQPSAGSPYPSDHGFNWDTLRDAARALDKDVLTEFAIPLANGATGARLLATVFPDAQLMQPTAAADLSRSLDAPKQRVLAAKARDTLRDEVGGPGVDVRWPTLTDLGAGPVTVPITFRRSTAHIPIDVTGLAIRSTNPALVASLNRDTVSLRTSTSETLDLTLEWRVGPRSWAPSSTEWLSAELTLTGTATTSWMSVLRDDLALTFTPRLDPATVTAAGRAQRGQPVLWTAGGLGLVVLIVLCGFASWRRRHPRPRGELQVADVAGSGRGTFAVGRRRTEELPLAAWGIPGRAHVRPRRVRPGGTGTATLVLEVVYNPGDASDSGAETRIGPNGSHTLSGVRFTWRLDP